MPPRNDIIAFVDLETTGTDDEKDSIIEVGIAVYTWPAMREDFAKSYLVTPTPEAYKRMNEKDVVREMHRVNGLALDIDTLLDIDPTSNLPEVIDERIVTDLERYGSRNSSHIPLAGSGVAHFDRRFIKRYLPKFDARLTHWSYDVGVLRRMWALAGKPPMPDDAKTHRALDDARVHAEEFKGYIEQIRQIELPVPAPA